MTVTTMTTVRNLPEAHTPAAPDRRPLIRLDAVSRRFVDAGNRSAFVAVDRVSLDIGAGERFGIIGSSGAGKSTLLRLINLLEKPDEGRVLIDGRDLTRLSRRDLRAARAGIGMIFQQFNLLQNATVYDNVAFPLTVQRPRPSRADRRARVLECLEVVGLTGKLDSYPAQLSGGQKQRVAIARALATRPAVMLCDEPTSALDSETTRSVLDVLADINQRFGVTLVVVTHELAVARRLCDRVAVMADGRIVEDLLLAQAGDRLETAIARATASDRGSDGGVPDAPDDASHGPDVDGGAARPAPRRRRVGGLPLPGKTASRDIDLASPIAMNERAVAANTDWMQHVAADAARALALDAWSDRIEHEVRLRAVRPRRVGGLPLPERTTPREDEAVTRAPTPPRRSAEASPYVDHADRRAGVAHV